MSEILDISDCAYIETTGFERFIEACGAGIRRLQASNCQGALTDETITKLAEKAEQLEFLDISYAKMVTDAGLKAFEGKVLPIEHLCVNGLTSTS